jgi:chorismate-pyruvate lyase
MQPLLASPPVVSDKEYPPPIPPASPADPLMPHLPELVGLFYERPEELGIFEPILSSQIPQPYRRLLAHNTHMTETVEGFHGCKVDVQVLASRRDNGFYSRKILLTRQSDGQVVQFGIPRLNMEYLDEEVRREIESETKPLGRVLIEHNVLREVQMVALWKVSPGPDLCRMFRLAAPQTVYGRTALIYCNGEPAIELLEIVTPQSPQK